MWGELLEGVEEQAGAMDVEAVGAEALEYLGEGALEFALGARDGDVEAAAGAAGVVVGYGLAARVVEVAVALAAHGGRAAAVVVGKDVGAGWRWHGGTPPLGYFLAENPERKWLRRGQVMSLIA